MKNVVSVVPSGELAFGVQLRVQSQSRIYAMPWEEHAGGPELASMAETADRSGWFYIAVCDHVAIPRDRAEAMSTTWYDTIATLGFLAARTERVRLLSHVYVPAYRHPLVVANAFATLDRLSNGRVILGVGTGHVEGEFAALGVDFSRRGALLDEAIDAIGAALEDEWPRHEGAEWSFSDVSVGPRPVQTPRPPIWVGGSSKPAQRRVARRGDGWLPQGYARDELPAAMDFIRAERERAGIDGPVEFGTLDVAYLGEPAPGLPEWVPAASAEETAERLRGYREMGLSHLQVLIPATSATDYCEQLEAIGTEVIPLVNG